MTKPCQERQGFVPSPLRTRSLQRVQAEHVALGVDYHGDETVLTDRHLGLLHLATDWHDYAEHMRALMERSSGFSNTAGTGAYANTTDRPSTKFEQRGRRLGHGVWDLVYRKTD